MAGFEPTTSSTPCWRDTGLRYIPSVSKNTKVFSISKISSHHFLPSVHKAGIGAYKVISVDATDAVPSDRMASYQSSRLLLSSIQARWLPLPHIQDLLYNNY